MAKHCAYVQGIARKLLQYSQQVHKAPMVHFEILNNLYYFNLNIHLWRGHTLWRGQWQPTPILLPGKSHGQRSLVGCSPWGRCKSDTTEQLHFHFSLSCVGEGNGNPLRCSCLENPRDGGAWWAAVYGAAQSRTQLKWQSSSSSSNKHYAYKV